MVLAAVPVTLNLLGVPSLTVGSQIRLLERKAAGVLAYVGLEGQVARERLASLLWPDVSESSARNNLRQVLWRLRSYGAELVVGDRVLTLDAQVDVDSLRFRRVALTGGSLDEFVGGELLAGKDFSDCPTFEEWLLAERKRDSALLHDTLWQRCRADQDAGDLAGALRTAARLLELDPLSEPVYRMIMTLHTAQGNRAAALVTFRTCREVLQRELGVSPLPETLALAGRIRRAGRTESPGEPQSPPPWQPPLADREVEWARLNAALDAGRMVLVSGPPGMGKTRLLLDVLRARGPVLCLEARPNDEAVPYLALGRLVRQLLKTHQDAALLDADTVPGPLEDWVRAEAAHLLPNLQPGEFEPGPLNSAAAQRRFLEAMTRLVTTLLPLALNAQEGSQAEDGVGSLLFDDDQWTDERSWEAWMFIFAQPEWRALGIQVGVTFRQGELPFARLDTLMRQVEGRAALMIDLQPLRQSGVQALAQAFLDHREQTLESSARQSLAGMSGTGTAGVEALWRHTGGSPLFVLETLRSLAEGGRRPTDAGMPEALPSPPELEPLLRRRLERVSEQALRLVRVAAVAGSEFDAELAAQVMGVHPLDLATPWAELETAQIMNGSAFAHDLIAQAAHHSVPLAVRELLHAQVADHLQGRAETHPRAAAPEHLALHWQEAGQPRRAAPHWLRAGWVALARGAWTEAASDFRQALGIAGSDLEQKAAATRAIVADAQYGLGVALRGHDPLGAEQALLAAQAFAPDIRREAEVAAALAELYRLCGRLDDALIQITRATDLGRSLPESEQAELWRVRFAVQLRSGRYAAAEEAIRAAQTFAPGRSEIVNEHALLLWMAGRLDEAAHLYESFRLGENAEQAKRPTADPAWYTGNLGWTYWALGRLTEAEAILNRPMNPPGSPFDVGVRRVHQATVSISQGRYHKALQELDEAEPALSAYPPHQVDLWHRRALLLIYAARYEAAITLLLQAVGLAEEINDPVRLSLAFSGLVAAYASLGRQGEAEQWGKRVSDLSAHVQVPLTQVVANQALVLVATLGGREAQAAELAEEAVRQSRACRMNELLARSLLVRATLRGAAHAEADLLEAVHVARAGGMLDVESQAARALSMIDPAWSKPADRLRRKLLSLTPDEVLSGHGPLGDVTLS